jgi:hypothetical protein
VRSTRLLLGLGALVLGSSCAAPVGPLPTLASATVVADFDTYNLRRVGVLPLSGLRLSEGLADYLQLALVSEFRATTGVEFVGLRANQLVGLPQFDPHLRGGYPVESILGLSGRHHLDALVVVTVTDRQAYTPQRLGLQAVLLSAETGMSLWQADLQLDAGDRRTRSAAESWAFGRGGDLSEDHWELILVSPRRFVQLAAAQLAKVL